MDEAQYNSTCLIGTKPSYNNIKTKKARNAGPPLNAALGSQSQRISEFEAIMVYI